MVEVPNATHGDGSPEAKRIIEAQRTLESSRSTFENLWREIDDRINVANQEFFGGHRVRGDKRTSKIFDATPVIALVRFGAALNSMLTPEQQRWHLLRAQNAEVNRLIPVREYFDTLQDILFTVRYSPKANFRSQIQDCYLSLGKYGTCALLTEAVDEGPVPLRYRSIPLNQLYIVANASGWIDTVYRRFKYTARQAAERWGKDALPAQVKKHVEDVDPDKEFWFIHVVEPNRQRDASKRDFRGMAFSSVYVSETGKAVVHRGGFKTFPYAVSRYLTNENEVYGRSPAAMVLPDIKMINRMSEDTIAASRLLIRPPMLLADDGIFNATGGPRAYRQEPGGLNYGGIDPITGRERIKPLNTGARPDFGEAVLEQRRNVVNDAFLVTLFEILIDGPTMTATEVLERAREKAVLLTPTMGRQQSELLGPTIERELSILADAGMLPPVPDELRELDDFEIEYDSPLTRSQRAEEGAGLLRTLEGLGLMAQFDETALDIVNPREAGKLLAHINAVPGKALRSDDELAELDRQRAEQAAREEAVNAAQPLATAQKQSAEAQRIQQETEQA